MAKEEEENSGKLVDMFMQIRRKNNGKRGVFPRPAKLEAYVENNGPLRSREEHCTQKHIHTNTHKHKNSVSTRVYF